MMFATEFCLLYNSTIHLGAQRLLFCRSVLPNYFFRALELFHRLPISQCLTLSVGDVGVVLQPTMTHVTHPSNSNKRLTFQHFKNVGHLANFIAPHNSDARILDNEEWPPSLIFDAAYGCAALKAWGVPAFINYARAQTRNIYYYHEDYNNNGNGPNGNGGQDRGGPSRGGDRHGKPDDSQSEKHRQQVQDREEQAARRRNRSAGQEPDIADIVLALWTQRARKGQHQVRAIEADRTWQEKVERWLESAE